MTTLRRQESQRRWSKVAVCTLRPPSRPAAEKTFFYRMSGISSGLGQDPSATGEHRLDRHFAGEGDAIPTTDGWPNQDSEFEGSPLIVLRWWAAGHSAVDQVESGPGDRDGGPHSTAHSVLHVPRRVSKSSVPSRL